MRAAREGDCVSITDVSRRHSNYFTQVGVYYYHVKGKNTLPVYLSFTTHTEHFISDTSGHQMCGDFSTTEPFSEIPAGCPIIQFNSDTNPSSSPQRWRTQSHKAVPHPHFRCESQVIGPQVTHNFCSTWLPITGSCDLLWIWSFWNSSHYYFPVIKECHKGCRQ